MAATLHATSRTRSPAGPAPLVSIVVNNHNYADYVARAIDSALAQTWPRVEVVVVDDGSTDRSTDVIAGYADRVLAVAKENGGQASAVNTGFAASRGDVVLFLDADDELRPDAAARVVDAMRPGVAKVHFRLAAVDGDGRPLPFTNPPGGEPLGHGDLAPHLVRRGRYVTPVMSGNAYARPVLERLLPMPEEEFRLCADGYLVTGAPFFGRVAAIEDALGHYRLHGRNGWSRATVDARRLGEIVTHERRLHALIERLAAGEPGLRPASPVGANDPVHLRYRLAAHRLGAGPAAGDDGRWALTARGMWSALRDPGAPAARRARNTAWFLALGVAPRDRAATLVHYLCVPQDRPRRRRLSGSRRR